MDKKKRIIILSVLSILIVICIVLGITYSFMQANIDSNSVTEVSLSSCAKITLEDGGDAINIENSYPVSRNKGMQTDPYTFTVTSSCESYVGFNMYLATLDTNTLSDSSIHYVITRHDSKEALAEGILSEAENSLAEFSADEQNQIIIGINGTFGTIYKLYNANIPLQGSVTYDLYLFIDDSVTNDTMNQEFRAGVAIKSYDREADPTLAEYIINNVYTGVDGDNDLYYHDGVGTYGTLEAGDNSYRYSGVDPNNYVCFGSDAYPCPEENLYRIIGIFDGQIKLIKFYPYDDSPDDSYAWTKWDENNSNAWDPDSGIYPTVKDVLNLTYYNEIQKIDNGKWSSMIVSHTWKVGGVDYEIMDVGAKMIFDYEIGQNSLNVMDTMKIGLMYVSDWGYSISPTLWGWTRTEANSNADLFNYVKSSFINSRLEGTLLSFTISRELQTNYVFVSPSRFLFGIRTKMLPTDSFVTIQPTFYLNENVAYFSGEGTSSNPYRLS